VAGSEKHKVAGAPHGLKLALSRLVGVAIRTEVCIVRVRCALRLPSWSWGPH